MVKRKFIKTVSKYFENACLQNLSLHFMSSLTAEFIKNSQIQVIIHFFFLKNVLKQTLNQNFSLHFMSSLTAEFIKNSHIQVIIHFFFLKNVLKQTLNVFNTIF